MAKRSQYPIKASYGLIAPLDDYQFIADASRTFVVHAMSEGKFVEQLTVSIGTTAAFIDELISPVQLKQHEWWRIVSISGGTVYALPAPRNGMGAGEKTITSSIGWALTAGDRIGLVPNSGSYVATIGGDTGGSGAVDTSLLSTAANQVLQLAEETEINDKIADPTTAWSKYHNPAVNTVATITKTTPGAGFRLVITKISWRAATGTTAPTAAVATVSLVDNAGSPVTYWAETAPFPASACVMNGASLSCWIPLAENVAATLAFSGAGGANTYESVFMDGHVEPVA